MVYISLLQHSDTAVKASWPNTGEEYYMVTPWLYLPNCPPEGAGVGFITTLTMHGRLGITGQTIQLECPRHVA